MRGSLGVWECEQKEQIGWGIARLLIKFNAERCSLCFCFTFRFYVQQTGCVTMCLAFLKQTRASAVCLDIALLVRLRLLLIDILLTAVSLGWCVASPARCGQVLVLLKYAVKLLTKLLLAGALSIKPSCAFWTRNYAKYEVKSLLTGALSISPSRMPVDCRSSSTALADSRIPLCPEALVSCAAHNQQHMVRV